MIITIAVILTIERLTSVYSINLAEAYSFGRIHEGKLPHILEPYASA